MTTRLTTAGNAAKLEKIRADRDRLFSAGRYYEALQLYKSLINRSLTRKLYSDAEAIAYDGAIHLLQNGQINAGGELASQLVEVYGKLNKPCGAHELEVIQQITHLLLKTVAKTITGEAINEADKETNAKQTEQRYQALIPFLKSSLRWSSSEHGGWAPHGHPDIHLLLAHVFQTQGVFAVAHQHYVRAAHRMSNHTAQVNEHKETKDKEVKVKSMSDVLAEHFDLIINWASRGYKSEFPLFFARTILQYLCTENMKAANYFIQRINKMNPNHKEPILNACQFIASTCERDAAPLFDLIRHKYGLAFSRDPSLEQLLDKIAHVYFGRPAPKGFLDNLLSFGAPGASAPAAAAQIPAATASANVQADVD